jgi:hypothetical protein
MNTQSDILHNTKPGTLVPSLIPSAIGNHFFGQKEQIQIVHPLDIPISEVSVHHLKTKSDIQEIQFLRSEINLDLHRANDPLFAEHEKKEMN